MATFSVTITVPDANLTLALNGLKKVFPVINGESNLTYIRRVVMILLTQAAKNGIDQINSEAQPDSDPGITT